MSERNNKQDKPEKQELPGKKDMERRNPDLEFPAKEEETEINAVQQESSTRTNALKAEKTYDGISAEEQERSGPDGRNIIPDTPPGEDLPDDEAVNP